MRAVSRSISQRGCNPPHHRIFTRPLPIGYQIRPHIVDHSDIAERSKDPNILSIVLRAKSNIQYFHNSGRCEQRAQEGDHGEDLTVDEPREQVHREHNEKLEWSHLSDLQPSRIGEPSQLFDATDPHVQETFDFGHVCRHFQYTNLHSEFRHQLNREQQCMSLF